MSTLLKVILSKIVYFCLQVIFCLSRSIGYEREFIARVVTRGFLSGGLLRDQEMILRDRWCLKQHYAMILDSAVSVVTFEPHTRKNNDAACAFLCIQSILWLTLPFLFLVSVGLVSVA